MITQSLYMLAAFIVFSFVRVFDNKTWDKYLLVGASILALYGIYEVMFFFITGQSGDFLTNRTFGDGEVLGSAFQQMQLGSLTILRLKSLTGEPSMYAFTIIPFWLYAMHLKKRKTATLLFVSLCLSTSSTFIITIVFYLVLKVRSIWLRCLKKPLLSLYTTLFSILLILVISPGKIYSFLDQMVLSKLMMKDISGGVRSTNFFNHLDIFLDLPFMNKIFGVGFGYVRSTDMFSTLLVNTGLFGFLLFLFLFLYPVLKLGKSRLDNTLRVILIIILLCMMIAVPEYSYLSTWVFLGIAYNRVFNLRIMKKTNNNSLRPDLVA